MKLKASRCFQQLKVFLKYYIHIYIYLQFYRDNGLVILLNVNGQQIDRTRKNIIKIFKDVGFNIVIETNSKKVDFLDITFNL